jgi:hypothetical protein
MTLDTTKVFGYNKVWSNLDLDVKIGWLKIMKLRSF